MMRLWRLAPIDVESAPPQAGTWNRKRGTLLKDVLMMRFKKGFVLLAVRFVIKCYLYPHKFKPMKKIVMMGLLLIAMQDLVAAPDDTKKKRYVPKASMIFNPKIGLMMSNLSDAPSTYQTNAKVGALLGADFRFGKRVYFQPGVFYKQEGTMLIYDDGTVEQQSDISKNSLCLKAQAGFYVVNKEGFRIRLNAGPTYDVTLKQQVVVGNNTPVLDKLKSSALNVEGGVGLDIWFLSIDAGYTYGLGNAFRDGFSSNGQFVNSKLVGAYINAGIVIPIQKK